jgi:hypothetical protein
MLPFTTKNLGLSFVTCTPAFTTVNNTTHNIMYPTNVKSGDIIYVFFSSFCNTVNTTVAVSSVAGFTSRGSLSDGIASSDNGRIGLGVFVRRLDGTETGGFLVTLDSSSTFKAYVVHIRGTNLLTRNTSPTLTGNTTVASQSVLQYRGLTLTAYVVSAHPTNGSSATVLGGFGCNLPPGLTNFTGGLVVLASFNNTLVGNSSNNLGTITVPVFPSGETIIFVERISDDLSQTF